MPAFGSDPVRVRVPATSANLGPGFDALGLALTRYDDVTARITDGGLRVSVTGEGARSVGRGERHLVVRVMRETFARLGVSPPGLAVECANRIPHGRGLGSSAAAIVAGVLAARALVTDGPSLLDAAAMLDLAAELEGHPDNVAACLLGGLTVAWTGADGHRAVRLNPTARLRPVVFVPRSRASTARVRRLLPGTVPYADAVANVGRTALLVGALLTGGTEEVLLVGTEDRLHQPYRADAMPGTAELISRLRAARVPAVVSGAGPSVLALTASRETAARAAGFVPEGWAVHRLAVAAAGAQVVSASG
jgi:homoserine kinase